MLTCEMPNRLGNYASSTGAPNLSLTMFPFSIPTDERVSLQNFDR